MTNIMWNALADTAARRARMFRTLRASPVVQSVLGWMRTEREDQKMVDASDDLGIPTNASRPVGQVTSPARSTRLPAMPRRASALPRGPGNPPASETLRGTEAEIRQLIVGREITLSGEIKSCDKLVVEGAIEANLSNCRDMIIMKSGLFKGAASIENAEIHGRFEGNLIAHKRLLIKAGGRVFGTIKYGQIEVEAGGQISGDIQAEASMTSRDRPSSAGSAPTAASTAAPP